MKKNIWKVIAVLSMLVSTGCAGIDGTVYAAEKSEAVGKGMSSSRFESSSAYSKWNEEHEALRTASQAYTTDLRSYYEKIVPLMLEGNENAVFSPLNLFMAFGAFAECADGDTRSEVLEALGVDLETLRNMVPALYASNDTENPLYTSRLSGALFLKEDLAWKDGCLETLKDAYYMSSISGKMGSDSMNSAIQKWLNEATNDLLKEDVSKVESSERTALMLMTGLYYKNSWQESFEESLTTEETFHGENGDTTVSMMHRTEEGALVENDLFIAKRESVNYGSVWFVLPNEGVKMEDVLSSSELYDTLLNNSLDWHPYMVNEGIPKTEVHQNTDLIPVMEKLGITDMDDLSNLTDQPVVLSSAEHAALLKMDEEGIEGAAYTVMSWDEAALETAELVEKDFILDRPYLMFVKADDGSLVFAACVRNAG